MAAKPFRVKYAGADGKQHSTAFDDFHAAQERAAAIWDMGIQAELILVKDGRQKVLTNGENIVNVRAAVRQMWNGNDDQEDSDALFEQLEQAYRVIKVSLSLILKLRLTYHIENQSMEELVEDIFEMYPSLREDYE